MARRNPTKPASVRRPVVVLGFLGTRMDAGKATDRWERWRPTVGLCQQDDLVVDRLELLHTRRFRSLAEAVASDIASVSPETSVVLREHEIRDPWDLEEVYASLHDLAMAYPFDPEAEDYLVHITTGSHIEQICLFLLVETRTIPARLVQTHPRSGAAPEHRSHGAVTLIDLDLSRYDRLASRFRRLQAEGLSTLKSGIDTRNPAFNALVAEVERVALRTRDPILLTGSTGTGKSQLARRIHELRHSRHQVKGPLVTVNCATLRGEGAMSALFGHVRGAFTGALEARAGHLKAADGGMLFLDEIGELGLDEQAMLLSALEDKVFFPVGSDRETRSDFQLLAGTNRPLAAEVEAGRFREDLLARISLWTFELPSLADRREDLEPNLDFELARVSEERNLRVSMSSEARARYLAFAVSREAAWSANFRDLGASVRRMSTFAEGGRIDKPEVDREIRRLRATWSGATRGGRDDTRIAGLLGPDGAGALDAFDRVQLEFVLEVCSRSSTLSQAGRTLFAASRARRSSVNDADRLRKYLRRFGIAPGAALAATRHQDDAESSRRDA